MKLNKRDVEAVVEPEFRMLHNRVGLFNSSYQVFKRYGIPKAQLILSDIPYSLGRRAYGFEISKRFYRDACEALRRNIHPDLFNESPAERKRREYVQGELF